MLGMFYNWVYYIISNVNPGLINPVYGCLIGKVPFISVANNDYWGNTSLININHGLAKSGVDINQKDRNM